MLQKIAYVAVIVAGVVLAYSVISAGLNKNEVVECNQWKQQAGEYQAFFLLQWQKDQCDAHGIIINAPVK